MKRMKLLALTLVLVMAAGLFAGCAAGDDTIKIGTIQPLSGEIAVYGEQTANAMQLAVDEVNAAGGILGKQVELIVEDDEANPPKTKDAFSKLVDKDKVVGILGALTSNSSLAIAPDAQAQKIPMITSSSTNEKVTEFGDYVFRTCFIDPFQGAVNAKFAIETLGITKASILFDNTNDYSKGLAENFEIIFVEMGGEIISKESYAKGDKDFNAQLTTIKGGMPEVLFIPDYYSTVSLIAKQVRAQGMEDVIMMGGDGWDEIVNNAGEEVVGSFYSNHYSPESDDPDVKAFVAKYKEKYNDVTPNALAALGYDAAMVMMQAIEAAGSTDPEKIRDAIAATDSKFVTGHIKYDEKRNPIKSAVMIEVVNDGGTIKAVYAGTVNP